MKLVLFSVIADICMISIAYYRADTYYFSKREKNLSRGAPRLRKYKKKVKPDQIIT
jgi:hypothetical protein